MIGVNGYELALLYHSNYRWIALIALLILFVWTLLAHRKKAIYTTQALRINIVLTILITIQGLIGLALYSVSPIVQAFWTDISLYIKNRQVRFFGLEHIFMMSLGIILLWLNLIQSKKYLQQVGYFSRQLKMIIWILLIILTSIPWSFSPLTSRPNYRTYANPTGR